MLPSCWHACRAGGHRRRWWGLGVSLCAASVTLDAQNAPRPTVQSSRGRLAVTGCAGQPVSDIVVITQPPFSEKLPSRLEFVRRTVRTLHANTREELVRRFLLLRVGDACNQIQRAESERILRAQPFFVDARIRVYDDEKGGVRLEVETRDDVSLLFSPVIVGASPYLRAMQVGDGNVGGEAQRVVLRWRDGLGYRDRVGVEYANYLFGAARNELRVNAQRTEFGYSTEAQVVRPYYTDFQRTAWLASYGAASEPDFFGRQSDSARAVLTSREYGQIGGLVRYGSVGRLKLLGLSFTRERERQAPTWLRYTDTALVPDLTVPDAPPFRAQNVARLNALLGLRAIRFVRVQGFDALTGAQDVRVGAQLGLMAGQSLALSSGLDRDRFVSTGVYLGAGNEKWFVGAQGTTEGRYDLNTGRWRNMVASGRAAWYFRPAIRQTTVMQAEWAFGRDMESPMQLTLANRTGGLLGHLRSIDAGAGRLVFRADQRLVVPTRFNVADVGFAGFAEAGRLWDSPTVPFTVNTAWRGAVGFSLLAAIPPRSRRLWRVDFALPVSSDPYKRFQIRFSGTDRSRVFWMDPQDVQWARARTAPTSLFNWP